MDAHKAACNLHPYTVRSCSIMICKNGYSSGMFGLNFYSWKLPKLVRHFLWYTYHI